MAYSFGQIKVTDSKIAARNLDNCQLQIVTKFATIVRIIDIITGTAAGLIDIATASIIASIVGSTSTELIRAACTAAVLARDSILAFIALMP